MVPAKDPRVKQVIIGISFFAVLMTVVVGLMVGWRKLPGLLGEWVGIIVGVMSTPFFLEATFIIIGMVTVLSFNIWRRHKEGEEFVYLDQVSGEDIPGNLPDSAKWALYSKKPLEGEVPSLMALAEGAFAIGDYAGATEILAGMKMEELSRPETLRLRIELAKATGHKALAFRLEQELELQNADSPLA